MHLLNKRLTEKEKRLVNFVIKFQSKKKQTNEKPELKQIISEHKQYIILGTET